MRLKSALEKLNKDELVYIGSKSAFFFIGYPQDFINQCDEISTMWFKKYERAKNNAYKALTAHETAKPPVGANGFKQIYNVSKRMKENISVPYEVLLDQWSKRHKSLQTTYNTTCASLEKFKPFMERVVKEEYKRIDNTGTVIVIRGNESGMFWTYNEYLKKHNMSLEELEKEEEREEKENAE